MAMLEKIDLENWKDSDDKVAIGYSHVAGTVTAEFCKSLAILCCIDRHIVGLVEQSGPILPMNRNLCVNNFLSAPEISDAKWLWFVDTDMAFRADVLLQLTSVANATNADIVVVPYKTSSGRTIIADANRERAENLEPQSAYLCAFGGTGCMLISRSFLERMREYYRDDAPWQFFGYSYYERVDGTKEMMGEDYSFCLRARAMGAKLVCWTGVKLGHVKHQILTLD